MKISILIIVHEKEIAKEAIQSVLDQTYQNFDCTIWDSGKLYDSGFYDGLQARFRIIRSHETPLLRKSVIMPSWVFNEYLSLGMCKGDLLLYLCDDDIFYDNAFEVFNNYFEENPEVLAAYASQDVSQEDTILGERRATCIRGMGDLDCQIDYLQFCMRTSLLEKLPQRPYPEELMYKAHADGVFMERVARICPIYPIDIKVCRNRRTKMSNMKEIERLGS